MAIRSVTVSSAPATASVEEDPQAKRPLTRFEDVVLDLYETVCTKSFRETYRHAQHSLKTASEQKPDEAVFLNNLAVVLLYRGRYDEALTHARRALKILPGSKDVQDTIRQIEKARDADGAKKPGAKPAPKKKSEAKPSAKKKTEAKKPDAKKPEAKKPAEKPAEVSENPPAEDGPDALVPALPAAPETM